MAARERWIAEATDILGTPVDEVVPLARSKPSKPAWVVSSMVVGFFVVLLYEFGMVPGPQFLEYFVAPTAVVASLVLGSEQRFAAQTREGGIWLLTGTRVSPRPLARIGPVDPGQVSAPTGMFGNTFTIAGVKHQVAVQQKARFWGMVESASRPLAG